MSSSNSLINKKNIPLTVVVGGGIIGVCCALALQKVGIQVLLIEKDTLINGASDGNAGHIASEQIYPIASPEILKEIPKMLLDPLGPLRIDYRYLPQLTPWLIRLLLNLRSKPFTQSSNALQQLNHLSLAAWQRLLTEETLSHLMQANGSYLVAEKQNSAKVLQQQIPVLAKANVPAEWIEKNTLLETLPALNEQQLGGLFFPQTAHVVCPTTLRQALLKRFCQRGGETLTAEVSAVSNGTNNVEIHLIDQEKRLADQAVIATGIFSTNLVKSSSGIKPLLQAERGYHLMTEIPQTGLIAPVTSIDRRFIMTPMQHGLRLAGTVEYSSPTAKPNYQRATNLLTLANGLLREPLQRTSDKPWMGLRPTLPDSLPVIDRIGRIAYAFGHQHLGLTQAAITAEWITQLMTDNPVQNDLTPYQLNRFA